MGFLFGRDKPTTYAPSRAGGQNTLLGGSENAPPLTAPAAPALPAAPSIAPGPQRTAVIRDLPGVGRTYLDSEFSPKIDAFLENARRHGVNLEFESAYRDEARTRALMNNPAGHGVVSPAVPDSLHRAGLAVDVKSYLQSDEATRAIIRKSAFDAGLSWGGNYARDPDYVHFYLDPIPGGNRGPLIDNFTDQVRRLTSASAQVQ